MKKKKIVSEITHIFHGGIVVQGEDFDSEPYVILSELNRDFLMECNRAFGPYRYEKERIFGKPGDDGGNNGEV